MLTIEKRELDPNATILGMPQHEFDKLAKSILIVIPHRNTDRWNDNLFTMSKIWYIVGTDSLAVMDPFGGMIDVFRANLCRKVLDYLGDKPDVDKILMVDSDEGLTWETPFKLAMWDLPVVSGVVCNDSRDRGTYACFTVKDKYGVPRYPSSKYTKVLPAKGLLEVETVGAGLMCVKKAVLEEMFNKDMMPFEIPREVRKQSLFTGVLKRGEDTAFCDQVHELGHKIYVDLSVHAAHYKDNASILWPREAIDPSMSVEDFKVDVRDYYHG